MLFALYNLYNKNLYAILIIICINKRLEICYQKIYNNAFLYYWHNLRIWTTIYLEKLQQESFPGRRI